MILTLVLVGGVLNLILGVMILLRSKLDRVSRSFAIVCFTAATLIFFDAGFRLYPRIEILQNIFSIAVFLPAIVLLWVSEFLKLRWSFLKQFLIALPAIIFFILANINDLVIKEIIKILPFGYVGNLGVLFIPYTLTILVYIGFSVTLLYKKIGTIDKSVDLQIKYIIGGILSYSSLAILVSLILPKFLGIYDFTLLDAPSSILFVGFTALAILRSNLFEVRMVLVEASLIVLNFFLLINMLLSYESSSFLFNVMIFVLIFLFSIILMRGIYKDIRDRERIEKLAKEMDEANEKLRMMEGQKTEFVSIASHQLRTPLTVIKGYASMILEGTFGTISAEVRDAMEKLYKSSERIVSLVEDLLTVSRIEQGRMMLVFQPVDFREFVEGVLADVDEEIKESKLEISFTAEDGGTFRVLLDEKKFKQVIVHIIENSIKYTKAPGKIRIFLTEDGITNKVRLSISDTGSGMKTEQIYAVFERFNMKSNLDAAGMEKEAGNQPLGVNVSIEQDSKIDAIETSMMEKRTPGIGLYIAQEIIEAHHGTLNLDSAGMDKGTTVIIELPRVEVKE